MMNWYIGLRHDNRLVLFRPVELPTRNNSPRYKVVYRWSYRFKFMAKLRRIWLKRWINNGCPTEKVT